MERVRFGEKLTVAPVAIGTMNLLDWGVDARGLLNRVKEYIDLGLTTFDLADIYGGGGCEELFGQMLALEPSIRDKIEIISKGCIVYDKLRRPYFVSESYNLSKNYILSACNASLRRLGVESLDLYLLHRPCPLMDPAEVTEALAMHHKTSAELQPLDKKHLQLLPTDESKVLMAQYDAKQLYYLQYANLGKQFDVAADPEITLYNEYFGGGMNSVVFQEMREARGLAYTAQASIMQPNYADTKYGYMAFIATQNDKMQMAIEAFDEIINNMPESETAFKIAKEGLISRLRTDRTVKEQVLWSFIGLRNLGLEEDRDKQIFEKVQAMTLADVKAAQEKWVKNRKYVYGILGDIQDLDLNYLKTLGPIRTVSQEEIFGY